MEGNNRGFIEKHLDYHHFIKKLLALVPKPVYTTNGLMYSCPESGCLQTCRTKLILARHLAGRIHGYRDKFLEEALKEKMKEVAENSYSNQESVTAELSKDTTEYVF